MLPSEPCSNHSSSLPGVGHRSPASDEQARRSGVLALRFCPRFATVCAKGFAVLSGAAAGPDPCLYGALLRLLWCPPQVSTALLHPNPALLVHPLRSGAWNGLHDGVS